MDKEKIIIWGTGRASEHFVKADLNQEIFELLAFADNNKEKQGTYFMGKIVIAPTELEKYNYDVIIIASSFYDEISRDLMKNYYIPSSKIKNRYYRELEEIQKRYKAYYEKNKRRLNILEEVLPESEPVVIYTAITGEFDKLKEPLYIDKNFRYVCFTDDENLASDIWEIKHIKIKNNDYNRTAKEFKMLPHEYFPEYKWSIWIDGQLQITGNLRELVNKYNHNSNLLCFLHQVRSKIVDDAQVCKMLGFDEENVIDEQICRIMEDGFQDDNELIAGGFLVRKHNEKDVIQLMYDWWEMVCNGTRRDQLSFNYIAWKNRFFFDVTDLNIMDNAYFRRIRHEKIYK